MKFLFENSLKIKLLYDWSSLSVLAPARNCGPPHCKYHQAIQHMALSSRETSNDVICFQNMF